MNTVVETCKINKVNYPATFFSNATAINSYIEGKNEQYAKRIGFYVVYEVFYKMKYREI